MAMRYDFIAGEPLEFRTEFICEVEKGKPFPIEPTECNSADAVVALRFSLILGDLIVERMMPREEFIRLNGDDDQCMLLIMQWLFDRLDQRLAQLGYKNDFVTEMDPRRKSTPDHGYFLLKYEHQY